MARLPRLYVPGVPQHIIQRGNNRQVCFNSERDMTAYAHWLREAADKFGLAIHAWLGRPTEESKKNIDLTPIIFLGIWLWMKKKNQGEC